MLVFYVGIYLLKKDINMTQNDEQLEEDTIQCSRCEEHTPESEVIELGSWWVCGICYDDL
jgi:formylmethanofuran dehydrogenase subunit E